MLISLIVATSLATHHEAPKPGAADNTLSPVEQRKGWKLLFDGSSTKGWHNFKEKSIAPGWTIQDGILSSTDPSNAGDILTEEKFDKFELKLDYKMTAGGNSGIMFHVENAGEHAWHSGPEVQVYDNSADPKGQLAGWLYQLYSSKVDSTRPVGEWNTLNIQITDKQCWTKMNGVLYYSFDLTSEDFKTRLSKSKFGNMPRFNKLSKGSIAIQGDHGVVSFRNIKIRPIM